jgi:hypothetical protein
MLTHSTSQVPKELKHCVRYTASLHNTAPQLISRLCLLSYPIKPAFFTFPIRLVSIHLGAQSRRRGQPAGYTSECLPRTPQSPSNCACDLQYSPSRLRSLSAIAIIRNSPHYEFNLEFRRKSVPCTCAIFVGGPPWSNPQNSVSHAADGDASLFLSPVWREQKKPCDALSSKASSP